MHRPAAATFATAVLAATVLAGPASVVGAAPAQDPVPQISCGTLGDPICPVIDQVTALLAPLQPVLGLAGPALGDLGNATSALTALLESGPELPPDEVVAATGAVLDQLHALTDPLLDLLRSSGLMVAPLESALTQLQDLAGERLTPAAETAPTPAQTPAPAPTAPAGADAPSTPAGSGSTAAASTGSETAAGRSGNVPAAPEGGVLDLGPLAPPAYAFTAEPSTVTDEVALDASADRSAVAETAAALADELPDEGRATAVVLAISALLLAAGLLIDQARKARLPFRI